jgi:hypothetical protein
MMMRNVVLVTVICLFSINAWCQETKKKSVWAKLSEAMNPPGIIDQNTVDKYWNALTSKLPNDTLSAALLADERNRTVLETNLTMYDDRVGGFYLKHQASPYPIAKSKTATYHFQISNLLDYRFFTMDDETIKKKFNKSMTGNDVNVANVKNGGQKVDAVYYLQLDSAYMFEKHRIIACTIKKMDVEWPYSDVQTSKLVTGYIAGASNVVPFSNIFVKSKLVGCLTDFPFYQDEDWPKVAITFTSLPDCYKKQDFAGMETRLKELQRCPPAVFKATIWESKTKKVETGPMCYYPSDFKSAGFDAFDTWGIGSSRNSLLENTGYKRTSGPIPPLHPLPQSPPSQKEFFTPYSVAMMMLTDILYQIGYDKTRIGDRRVWVSIQEATK